jgi:uncharacterized damage-inducible protein DinB
MLLKDHVYLMADYNQWMNQKIYEAAGTLAEPLLHENKGAFFGSIFATLNHIVVADTLWLQRFAKALPAHQALIPIAELPPPAALDTPVCETFMQLKVRRQLLDESLSELAEELTDAELSQAINFKNTKGVEASKNLFSLLMHVFNHQTHHRGQVTTLLSQSGVDVGITDLAFIIPNT